jgi:hypothetical protein
MHGDNGIYFPYVFIYIVSYINFIWKVIYYIII